MDQYCFCSTIDHRVYSSLTLNERVDENGYFIEKRAFE